MWYLNSGCSRYMTGDKIKFTSLEPKDGGFVTFGDNTREKIIEIDTIIPRFQIHGMYSQPKLKGATQQKEEQLSKKWKIKMLYDGECPLCMCEVNMLRERSQAYGTIKFVDISSDNFSPAENQGLDYKTVMGRIHAIQSDGTVYTDVEAFRRLYEEVGLGWVYVVTKYEPISTIANVIYKIWATYRLQLTGRPSLEKILELKKNAMGTCNDGKVCKM